MQVPRRPGVPTSFWPRFMLVVALCAAPCSAQTGETPEVTPYPSSEPHLRENLVKYLDRLGEHGENLKAGLQNGSICAMFAENVREAYGAKAVTQVDLDTGKLVILIDVAYHKSTVFCWFLAVHEQAHIDLGHPPAASSEELYCQEFEATCEELCALNAYAEWADAQVPPESKLPCTLRDELELKLLQFYRLCIGDFWLGEELPCPCSNWPDVCE